MTAHPYLRFVLWPALALLVACSGNGKDTDSARPALVVQAGTGSAVASAFAGEVRARHEPVLAFRINGKVLRRQAEVGDRVKRGQLLAELDPADVALQLEGARAALASAEADLALASAELERHRSLFERQLISRSLFETRAAAHQAAEARLRQAKAQASASGNQASYAQLRAPEDGVIAQRLAEVGQVLAAGQPMFVLAVDGEREIAISVPEQSAQAFAPGRELQVELWAAPGEFMPGRLREIAPAADSASRTYAARVTLLAGARDVELGQSARVYALDSGVASLSLPLSALHALNDKPAVWRVNPDTSTVTLTPVQIGAYTENEVPVTGGLAAGDWVVAAGVHLLRNGQPIKPIDRSNRPVALAPVAAETAVR